jgi:hypothetical protein
VAGCASNWLAAPAVPFRPVVRLYQSRAAILDGTHKDRRYEDGQVQVSVRG